MWVTHQDLKVKNAEPWSETIRRGSEQLTFREIEVD
jgi:hypothetical protein